MGDLLARDYTDADFRSLVRVVGRLRITQPPDLLTITRAY
jgi:hypothetical protein